MSKVAEAVGLAQPAISIARRFFVSGVAKKHFAPRSENSPDEISLLCWKTLVLLVA